MMSYRPVQALHQELSQFYTCEESMGNTYAIEDTKLKWECKAHGVLGAY